MTPSMVSGLTVETWVQSQPSTCGMWWQSGTKTGFSLSTTVFACPYHSSITNITRTKSTVTWNTIHGIRHPINLFLTGTLPELYTVIYSVYTQLYTSIVTRIYVYTQITLWQLFW